MNTCQAEPSNTPSAPSGLIPNWKKARAKPTSDNRSQSMAATSAQHHDGSLTNPEMDGDPAFVPGGLPSDDETVERHALDVKKHDAKGNTKVSPLHPPCHSTLR